MAQPELLKYNGTVDGDFALKVPTKQMDVQVELSAAEASTLYRQLARQLPAEVSD